MMTHLILFVVALVPATMRFFGESLEKHPRYPIGDAVQYHITTPAILCFLICCFFSFIYHMVVTKKKYVRRVMFIAYMRFLTGLKKERETYDLFFALVLLFCFVYLNIPSSRYSRRTSRAGKEFLNRGAYIRSAKRILKGDADLLFEYLKETYNFDIRNAGPSAIKQLELEQAMRDFTHIKKVDMRYTRNFVSGNMFYNLINAQFYLFSDLFLKKQLRGAIYHTYATPDKPLTDEELTLLVDKFFEEEVYPFAPRRSLWIPSAANAARYLLGPQLSADVYFPFLNTPTELRASSRFSQGALLPGSFAEYSEHWLPNKKNKKRITKEKIKKWVKNSQSLASYRQELIRRNMLRYIDAPIFDSRLWTIKEKVRMQGEVTKSYTRLEKMYFKNQSFLRKLLRPWFNAAPRPTTGSYLWGDLTDSSYLRNYGHIEHFKPQEFHAFIKPVFAPGRYYPLHRATPQWARPMTLVQELSIAGLLGKVRIPTRIRKKEPEKPSVEALRREITNRYGVTIAAEVDAELVRQLKAVAAKDPSVFRELDAQALASLQRGILRRVLRSQDVRVRDRVARRKEQVFTQVRQQAGHSTNLDVRDVVAQPPFLLDYEPENNANYNGVDAMDRMRQQEHERIRKFQQETRRAAQGNNVLQQQQVQTQLPEYILADLQQENNRADETEMHNAMIEEHLFNIEFNKELLLEEIENDLGNNPRADETEMHDAMMEEYTFKMIAEKAQRQAKEAEARFKKEVALKTNFEAIATARAEYAAKKRAEFEAMREAEIASEVRTTRDTSEQAEAEASAKRLAAAFARLTPEGKAQLVDLSQSNLPESITRASKFLMGLKKISQQGSEQIHKLALDGADSAQGNNVLQQQQVQTQLPEYILADLQQENNRADETEMHDAMMEDYSLKMVAEKAQRQAKEAEAKARSELLLKNIAAFAKQTNRMAKRAEIASELAVAEAQKLQGVIGLHLRIYHKLGMPEDIVYEKTKHLLADLEKRQTYARFLWNLANDPYVDAFRKVSTILHDSRLEAMAHDAVIDIADKKDLELFDQQQPYIKAAFELASDALNKARDAMTAKARWESLNENITNFVNDQEIYTDADKKSLHALRTDYFALLYRSQNLYNILCDAGIPLEQVRTYMQIMDNNVRKKENLVKAKIARMNHVPMEVDRGLANDAHDAMIEEHSRKMIAEKAQRQIEEAFAKAKAEAIEAEALAAAAAVAEARAKAAAAAEAIEAEALAKAAAAAEAIEAEALAKAAIEAEALAKAASSSVEAVERLNQTIANFAKQQNAYEDEEARKIVKLEEEISELRTRGLNLFVRLRQNGAPEDALNEAMVSHQKKIKQKHNVLLFLVTRDNHFLDGLNRADETEMHDAMMEDYSLKMIAEKAQRQAEEAEAKAKAAEAIEAAAAEAIEAEALAKAAADDTELTAGSTTKLKFKPIKKPSAASMLSGFYGDSAVLLDQATKQEVDEFGTKVRAEATIKPEFQPINQPVATPGRPGFYTSSQLSRDYVEKQNARYVMESRYLDRLEDMKRNTTLLTKADLERAAATLYQEATICRWDVGVPDSKAERAFQKEAEYLSNLAANFNPKVEAALQRRQAKMVHSKIEANLAKGRYARRCAMLTREQERQRARQTESERLAERERYYRDHYVQRIEFPGDYPNTPTEVLYKDKYDPYPQPNSKDIFYIYDAETGLPYREKPKPVTETTTESGRFFEERIEKEEADQVYFTVIDDYQPTARSVKFSAQQQVGLQPVKKLPDHLARVIPFGSPYWRWLAGYDDARNNGDLERAWQIRRFLVNEKRRLTNQIPSSKRDFMLQGGVGRHMYREGRLFPIMGEDDVEFYDFFNLQAPANWSPPADEPERHPPLNPYYFAKALGSPFTMRDFLDQRPTIKNPTPYSVRFASKLPLPEASPMLSRYEFGRSLGLEITASDFANRPSVYVDPTPYSVRFASKLSYPDPEPDAPIKPSNIAHQSPIVYADGVPVSLPANGNWSRFYPSHWNSKAKPKNPKQLETTKYGITPEELYEFYGRHGGEFFRPEGKFGPTNDRTGPNIHAESLSTVHRLRHSYFMPQFKKNTNKNSDHGLYMENIHDKTTSRDPQRLSYFFERFIYFYYMTFWLNNMRAPSKDIYTSLNDFDLPQNQIIYRDLNSYFADDDWFRVDTEPLFYEWSRMTDSMYSYQLAKFSELEEFPSDYNLEPTNEPVSTFSTSLFDFAHSGQMGFQNSAAPSMEGIIDLHHDLMFFLITIVVFVMWLLISVIQNYYLTDQNGEEITNVSLIPSLKSHNVKLETVWSISPACVLVAVSMPSFALIYELDDVLAPGLTLRVVGHQWYWSYEYANMVSVPKAVVSSYTPISPLLHEKTIESRMILDPELIKGQLRLLNVSNRVVLPVDTDIRIVVTSTDVLHSWAVPSLGFKLDACPGRLNQAPLYIKRMGVFYGQCSELCGVGHAFMPIVVESVSRNDFETWINEFSTLRTIK